MFKRVLLTLTIVVALGAAGFGTNKALAWDDCGTGYRTALYPSYPPYYPTYTTPYPYAPSVSYYRAPVVVRSVSFHDGHHDHHHHDHNHVSFSFGF